VDLGKFLHFNELVVVARQSLIKKWTPQNIWEITRACAKRNLSEDIDSCIWFIAKQNCAPSEEETLAMKQAHPAVLARIEEQKKNTTVSGPAEITLKLSSWKKHMKRLFVSRAYSDFTISVGGKSFDVHRCVLAPRWPYFKSILLKNHPVFAIHETDMPASTFEKMLEFFYTFDVPKTLRYRDCGWILSLSEFYGITADLDPSSVLLNYCDQGINKKVKKKNWQETLQVAVELNDAELEKKFVDAFASFSVSDGLEFVAEMLKKKRRQQERTEDIEHEIKQQAKQIKYLLTLKDGSK